MPNYDKNSQKTIVFHSFPPLEDGARLSGYSALIQAHNLKVPVPDYLCAIGTKHKRYNYEGWRIFTPRHKPEDTLYGHLIFALKYEGIDLAIFNIDMPDKFVDLLIRFLVQNGGKLSKRAREKEFEKLTEREIQAIEHKYAEIFV